MPLYEEGDGWRNEDSEGPAHTVRTKYDWKNGWTWVVGKVYFWEKKFQLTNRVLGIQKEFDTIDEAKSYANDYMHTNQP